eukprot:TRINITY_DN7854_c0_g1_i1.p1 TRINITY_DN7854_c0_g1~~TRINITY_DN7854_c0_g1_i1.p1  ORF type:complete len:594 (+),score=57.56 TRINITY_DN7854_c0_g1_i1:93-1874(+)
MLLSTSCSLILLAFVVVDCARQTRSVLSEHFNPRRSLPLIGGDSGSHSIGIGQDSERNASVSYKLMWQGESLPLSVDSHSHVFSKDDLHREFIFTQLVPGEDEVVAATTIYLRTSNMCGVGLFSQKTMNCSAVHFDDLQYLRDMIDQRPSERAFGVELELVGRQPNTLSSFFRGVSDAVMKTNIYRLREVMKCYDAKNGYSANKTSNTPCSHLSECTLAEFCSKSERKDQHGYCKSRKDCKPSKSVDGVCPLALEQWTWTDDNTVRTLRRQEAIEAEAADVSSELKGVGFELISPPLSGRVGFTSLVETMGLLERLGVQAGPSQGMHVHVNVGRFSDKTTSSYLNAKQIFNVWASYARFQSVINEMLQDSRVGNPWCLPLTLAKHLLVSNFVAPTYNATSDDEGEHRLDFVEQMYTNMQRHLKEKGVERNLFHCIDIHARLPGPYRGSSCSMRRPQARYFQLNLIPLDRLGTIEFRGFPATNDPVRALRWVQFVVNFVDKFKDDGRFAARKSARVPDLHQLRRAQQAASLDDLESEMNMDLSYWRKRPWLEKSLPCSGHVHSESEDFREIKKLQTAMQEGRVKTIVVRDGGGD